MHCPKKLILGGIAFFPFFIPPAVHAEISSLAALLRINQSV